MSEHWRCFVAVPIGEALRGQLANAVEAWKARPDLEGLRWTDPGGWHVTLAFLGAIKPNTIDDIRATIGDVVASRQPIELETGGVGGFPYHRRATVAWYGVADSDGALAGLATRLQVALRLNTSAPFRAHLTLGRARGEPVDLSAWRSVAAEPRGLLRVASIEVMRSHLGRGPASYERLSASPLGVAAHV